MPDGDGMYYGFSELEIDMVSASCHSFRYFQAESISHFGLIDVIDVSLMSDSCSLVE